MRLRLDLAYDGSQFSGWAAQPGLRTVEGVLTEAVTRVLRLAAPVALTVAGRTDAGVHARGQVAHLDLPDDVSVALRDAVVTGPGPLGTHLVHRLRRLLPPDVVVHTVVPAPPGFDARFAAIWRRYRYRIWDDSSRPDPLLRHQVAFVRGTLDTDAMHEAADRLVGLHDFAAFCKPREGATTIRTVLDAEVVRADDDSATIEVGFRADAFCHSMVRSLTGALVAVGEGRRPRGWVDELLAAPARQSSVLVMPAAGLTLEQVGYPADDQLAARVTQARARRDEEGR